MENTDGNRLESFEEYLRSEEKSPATIQKYIHDVAEFLDFMEDAEPTRDNVLEYKNILACTRKPLGVNAVISSLNGYFLFLGTDDLKMKKIKVQRESFATASKELTKKEYERLVNTAKKKDERLFLVLQTVCSTGIRISELKYVTIEAAYNGYTQIGCKGKLRQILLPNVLCTMLISYSRKKKISTGSIFVTKNGKPLDRSNIWAEMKKLCVSAKVAPEKVFPHNLRHLFARTHYSVNKDIVRLADVLGHSSIETTRIYTIESGEIHRKQLQKLGLVQC